MSGGGHSGPGQEQCSYFMVVWTAAQFFLFNARKGPPPFPRAPRLQHTSMGEIKLNGSAVGGKGEEPVVYSQTESSAYNFEPAKKVEPFLVERYKLTAFTVCHRVVPK